MIFQTRKIIFYKIEFPFSKKFHPFLKSDMYCMFFSLLKQNPHVKDNVKLYILLLILLFTENIFTAFFFLSLSQLIKCNKTHRKCTQIIKKHNIFMSKP